jgi:hypothetical protein
MKTVCSLQAFTATAPIDLRCGRLLIFLHSLNLDAIPVCPTAIDEEALHRRIVLSLMRGGPCDANVCFSNAYVTKLNDFKKDIVDVRFAFASGTNVDFDSRSTPAF